MSNQAGSGFSQSQENKVALHQSWLGNLSESSVSAPMNVTVMKQLGKLRKVAYRKIASSKVVDPIIRAKLSQIS